MYIYGAKMSGALPGMKIFLLINTAAVYSAVFNF